MMKPSSFLAIQVAFVLLATFCSEPVAAQQNPLKCTIIDRSEIRCDVTANKVTISNVVINRGNCKSPVLPASEKNSALRWGEETLERLKSQGLHQYAFLKNLWDHGQYSILASAATDANITFILNNIENDPSGEYEFGDEVEITPLGRCNILEFVITANGRDWKWIRE
jgi:hypothetical protein